MHQLNFPSFNFLLTKDEKGIYIFDILRKKYLLLTPEEWVRQHLIHFLIEYKSVPQSLMQIEASLKVGKMQKRCDLLIHNKQQKPLLLVECKRASHELTQADLDQTSRYNTTFKVPFLLLTNGLNHLFIRFNEETKMYEISQEIPNWEQLNRESKHL